MLKVAKIYSLLVSLSKTIFKPAFVLIAIISLSFCITPSASKSAHTLKSSLVSADAFIIPKVAPPNIKVASGVSHSFSVKGNSILVPVPKLSNLTLAVSPEATLFAPLYLNAYVVLFPSSFEYALAYYNLIPEMVYKVTSATTKTTREFVTDDKTYSYSTIKPVAYTGYELKVIDEKRFLMAEAEKAAVDYLYLVSLNKRAWLERLDLSSVNKNKVKFYAGLFGKKSLDKLIKKYA